MRDIDYDTDDQSPYECFECGSILLAEANPGACPDCNGPMRNRWTPLE